MRVKCGKLSTYRIQAVLIRVWKNLFLTAARCKPLLPFSKYLWPLACFEWNLHSWIWFWFIHERFSLSKLTGSLPCQHALRPPIYFHVQSEKSGNLRGTRGMGNSWYHKTAWFHFQRQRNPCLGRFLGQWLCTRLGLVVQTSYIFCAMVIRPTLNSIW